MHFIAFVLSVVSLTASLTAVLGVPNAATPVVNVKTVVNLRIEGANDTIFEGLIFTSGHNITTASGGTHHCDGTNNNTNRTSGPTCTSALDDASDKAHFTFDGTFFTESDDYFITRIGSSSETDSQFWGLLLNFRFTQIGGCQQQVEHGDKVLWAFDAFNKEHFLSLTGPSIVHVNQPAEFTVVDGTTGDVVDGATVAGDGVSGVTGVDGKVQLTFGAAGAHAFKAERSDSIRSNRVEVRVLP